MQSRAWETEEVRWGPKNMGPKLSTILGKGGTETAVGMEQGSGAQSGSRRKKTWGTAGVKCGPSARCSPGREK